MRQTRREEVARVRGRPAATLCLVFGTLGRQCNQHLFDRMVAALPEGWAFFAVMLSEFEDGVLQQLAAQSDAIVQTCCPRMSIDWLAGLAKPVLNSYEYFVAVGLNDWA
jgi:2-(3-amino-3-carboxypropyl)histidine synthase